MNTEYHLQQLVRAGKLFRENLSDSDLLKVGDEFNRVLDESIAHLNKAKPTVVCLCGSTKFKDQFVEANRRLTLAGYIVLTVGWFSHADHTFQPSQEEKIQLDELHFRKIDLADEILVISVGGYIGDSTRNEIAYAKKTGKPVNYLESD